MNFLSAKQPKPNRVIIFVPADVQLLDLAGVALAFGRGSDYGAPYDIVFSSMDTVIRSIGSIELSNFVPYTDIQINKTDTLLIPGFDGPTPGKNSYWAGNASLKSWLRHAVKCGATVCSICSGVYLLAMAGILDGCDCATHWSCVDHLQKQFPNVSVLRDRLFVQSRENVYTSAGVTSGIDLALHILKERHGPKVAFQVARRLVVYTRRDGNSDQESVYLKFRNHVDDTIHSVQDWLMNHIDKDTSLESLAERFGMSSRSLTRNFKKRTGLTVGQYVDELRIEKAHELLLSTNCTIEHIAQECGFSGARQLNSLFRKRFGKSPRNP